MERRNFLTALGLLTGGALTGLRGSGLPSPDEIGYLDLPPGGDIWSVIRQQFLFPEGFIFLNCGGIGSVPLHVRSLYADLWNQMDRNPEPGYDANRWNQVKSDMVPLLGKGIKPSELALISCATEGVNIIVNGLPLKKGDEVITSTHEHPAVNVPLINNMKRRGIVIKTFDPDIESGMNNLLNIQNLTTKKTRLIIISHRTCTNGQLFPMKEIGEFARANGIWYGLDGAQAPGSAPMDILDLKADFYTFSAHKWLLGPKRTGVLYVREELLDTVEALTAGGTSYKSFNLAEGKLELQDTAQRYEYGTQNPLLFFGLQESMKLISDLGLARIKEYDESLSEHFYAGLNRMPHVETISPKERAYRTSMISFRIPGLNAARISERMMQEGIRVRVVNEAGLNAIRVSFHVFNNIEDADKALNSIDSIRA